MSKLMQSRVVLRGAEIDFAQRAVERRIADLEAAGQHDMAAPYEGVLERIRAGRALGDGTSSPLALFGGAISCFRYALENANDKEEGFRLAELVRKQTRGASSRYA